VTEKPVLDVKQLKTYFYLDDQKVAKAVDNVSFSIFPGETVALVGESGSGKSMTALSIMQLVDRPGRIKSGKAYLNDDDMLKRSFKQMSHIRGKDIAMIFQEPMTALNPVFTIGSQITEILRKHKKLIKKEAVNEAIRLLKLVGIPRAEEVINEYPHQLSGGMRQRVMIAMAISCEPQLLIADEPTTALDVTIQAQILDLMIDMKNRFQSALLLITHDLGVVSQYADRVLVMYGGQIVEQAETNKLLNHPSHPYTKGLLESLPDMEKDTVRLGTIDGTVPPAYNFPKGCRFSTRCPFVMDQCLEKNPKLSEAGQDHKARCYLVKEGAAHDSSKQTNTKDQ